MIYHCVWRIEAQKKLVRSDNNNSNNNDRKKFDKLRNCQAKNGRMEKKYSVCYRKAPFNGTHWK